MTHLVFDSYCDSYSLIQYYTKSYFLGYSIEKRNVALFENQFSIFDIALRLINHSKKKSEKPESVFKVPVAPLNTKLSRNRLNNKSLEFRINSYASYHPSNKKSILSSFNKILFCLSSLKRNIEKKRTLIILKPIEYGFRSFCAGIVGFFPTTKFLKSLKLYSKSKVDIKALFQIELGKLKNLILRAYFLKAIVSISLKKRKKQFVKSYKINRKSNDTFSGCIKTIFK